MEQKNRFSHVFSTFIFLALFALGLHTPVVAENEFKNTLSLNFIAATTLETKVKLIHTTSIPMFVGQNALTKGNNLQLRGIAEFSPVSLNAAFDATLTPVAFLQVVGGASIGTGWNIPIAHGLRINEPVLDASGKRTGDARLVDHSFKGVVWSTKAGGVFQFDLGAVIPGEWTHVLFQTMHVAQYRGYTGAKKNESWLYEADTGENRNGWNYYGNWFLGYKLPPIMPLGFDLFGVLLEEDLYLYGTEGGSEWGDTQSRMNFGPICNLTLSPRLSVALLAQWHTVRNFTNETKDNKFYQDRKMIRDNPVRIKFYRAALNATLILK